MNRLIVFVIVRSRRRSTAVQLGGDGVGNALDLLEFLLEVIGGGRLTLRVDPISGLLDSVQERLLVIVVQLATEALRDTELGFEAVDIGGEGVKGFDALLLGLVVSGKLLSLGNHAANLLLAETALLIGDCDRLGFTGALVGGGDLHDTVGVNLECDLDLGNTAWSGGDTGELELAKEVVVLGEGTFTLEDLDQDGGLVIRGGGEDLTLANGDDAVTGNELGHDTTRGLDTESEGVDVEEEDAAQGLVAGEDTTLNSGAIGNGLVRVNTLGRLLSKEFLEELLDLGDTGRATDENDLQDGSAVFATTDSGGTYLIDVLLLEIGILKNLLDRLHGLPEQVHV